METILRAAPKISKSVLFIAVSKSFYRSVYQADEMARRDFEKKYKREGREKEKYGREREGEGRVI